MLSLTTIARSDRRRCAEMEQADREEASPRPLYRQKCWFCRPKKSLPYKSRGHPRGKSEIIPYLQERRSGHSMDSAQAHPRVSPAPCQQCGGECEPQLITLTLRRSQYSFAVVRNVPADV